MDFGKITNRVKAILTTPKTEWPLIAIEPASVGGLYATYIAILAAIPAIAGFIKSSLIGYSLLGMNVRTPVVSGIAHMVVSYLVSLLVVYVVSLIINWLAPTFGGQKDNAQALKATAYAWTAAWVAGIAVVIPWLGVLIALAGMVYAIYLLYLGLPLTMRCPPEKAAAYTAVSVIITIVLSWIVAVVVAAIVGTAMFGGAAMGGIRVSGHDGANVSFAKNALLARVVAMSRPAQPAGQGQDPEMARKFRDRNMQHAVSGSRDVQVHSPDQLKRFLPARIAGMAHSHLGSSGNFAMFQVLYPGAVYGTAGGTGIFFEIADTGSANRLMARTEAIAPVHA